MKKRKGWFRFLMWKRYFDRGWGLLGQVKYAIALFGGLELVRTQSLNITMMIGVGYCAACFLLGRWWIKHRIMDIENEINNIFNPFQNDVRKKLNIKKIYKAPK